MPKHVVKQFGLQRTGTNYVRQLLMHNYNVKVLTNGGGWKHGRYKVKRSLGHEVDCIVMVKDLLSWLWSYYRYAGKEGSFQHFVMRGTHVEHWNALNAHWLDVAERLKDSKMVFSRCEDLVANPKKECQRIAKALGLTRTKGRFWDTDKRINAGGKLTPHTFNRGALIRGDFMKNYTRKLIKFVAELQDEDVAVRLGYKPL